MWKYNLCDVKVVHAKVREMAKGLQVGAPEGKTVPEQGETMWRFEAKKRYQVRSLLCVVPSCLTPTVFPNQLHDNQMDRIRPCVIEPYADKPEATPKRRYNVCDVQASTPTSLTRSYSSAHNSPV